MGVAGRAGALVCAAAVAAPVLAAVPAPPPAQADTGDGGVDAAVEAFSAGEVVYVDEEADAATGEGGDGRAEQRRAEQTRAYVRARLEEAGVPVRAEVLADGDAGSAAQETATRVGRPGLYVAVVERRRSTGGRDVETGWAWVGAPAVTDDELDDHFAFYLGGPLEQIAGIVDLIEGDLRPAAEDAAEEGERVYVDPALAEGFPQADAEELEGRLGDLEDVRVAVIPGLARAATGDVREELVDALLEPLGDEGSVLLAEWRYGAFDLTPATAKDAPQATGIRGVLPDGAPEELNAAVGAFAGAVDGGVVDDARKGLAEEQLYVHPLAATDLEEGDAEKVGAALASREVPVRVAVVPAGAHLETGGSSAGDEALAASVARGVDGPVAVYAVDGGGRITGYPVKGGEGVGGNWDSLEDSVFFGKDDDSMRESLDGLLQELGEAPVLGAKAGSGAVGGAGGGGTLGEALSGFVSAAGRALPWIGGGVGLVLLVLFLRGSFAVGRERRRVLEEGRREREEKARREQALMDELRAEEAERVEEIRARNAEDITRLGEELAGARAPGDGERLAAFEAWLREYESLKEDNPKAEDIDRIVAVRKRVESALADVERWNRRR
ncbi:hypothetical protein O4J56_20950 [Nocardiopsis sp. RSe5-2]|uniref:TPM domain-containing protein n=1 Tax=Nocardiopsis endophytica TaxID=3018445 RepID=A0ABT4U849_9ACTN|nr:hypothetical protein [Nocardiopsis endophytica]MDA2813128.1 hypothetical protein [Nocardiopsis endophytica]